MCLTCPQETDSAVKVLLLLLSGYFVQRFLRYILNRGDGSMELRPANPNYSALTATAEEVESEWVKTIGKSNGGACCIEKTFLRER